MARAVNLFAIVLSVTLLTLSMTTPARAEIYFRPGFMYLIDGEETSSTDKESRQRQLIDLAFGYIGGAEWTVGALYGTEREDTKTTSSSGTSEISASRTSFGPSLGWTSKGQTGAYVLATYFLQSEYVRTPITNRGSGYQIDLGLRFPVQRTFVAMQLSYKSFEYKKQTTGTSETNLASPLVHNYLDPYFALFFQF